jgi:hypothetical protein
MDGQMPMDDMQQQMDDMGQHPDGGLDMEQEQVQQVPQVEA